MFELRSYTRKELSLLYFPNNTPRGAYQNFRRWLIEQDEACSFWDKIKGRRIFSKSEVKQIVELLGEP